MREFGNHKAGIKEKNLCKSQQQNFVSLLKRIFPGFEVAGRDGNAGGVIPEHLHRYFEN